jgi:hypothetical protein
MATLNETFSGGNPGGDQSRPFLARIPLFFSTRLRLGRSSTVRQHAERFFKTTQFMRVIATAINPSSIKWSQPKRITEKPTLDGSTFFHFTNSKRQNNGVLVLTIEASTGNIDRRGSGFGTEDLIAGRSAGPDTGAALKLLIWHNLYLLTREPQILDDGAENQVYVVYSSPLFPESLIMRGHISREVMPFTETAQKPNSRTFTLEFTATATQPDLDEYLAGLSAAIANGSPEFDAAELLGFAGPLTVSTL